MKYAIIKTGGKQYKVSPGDVLEIEKIEGKEKAKIVFDQVLLFCQGKKLLIGQPLLKKTKVKGEIISQFKDKKIRVSKFRAKSRYRKVKGHRQKKTKVKILTISANSAEN